jgi:actin-related protein 9
MEAFLAFLDHVHSQLTSTYHNTPIMLMGSPHWTRPDCEAIARYIFEKTKTPALCIMHSGLATQYGLKWPHMTVVDIGFEKVDVTCIYDSRAVAQGTLGYPSPDRAISGGEVFTQRLLDMLKRQEFTYDMAEQLKKSAICEVLPYVPENEALMDLPVEAGQAAPAATAAAPPKSATAGPGEGPRIMEPARPQTEADGEDTVTANGGEKGPDEDGVLDVANIVASGQTREFLAKKEKEKAEKGKSRKGAREKETESAAARPARLPNPKRSRNVFHYEEVVMQEVTPEAPRKHATAGPATENGSVNVEMKDAPPAALSLLPTGLDEPAAPLKTEASEQAAAAGADETQLKAEPGTEQPNSGAAADDQAANPTGDNLLAAVAPPPPAQPDVPLPERQAKRMRRDIEVGLERFTFADRTQIDRIVSTIYNTVQSIEDMYMRPPCWDSIVFVGNGARIRGLKENIMQTLNARHLVSPSTATMFTSELPSNLATPSGTGSQTPTGSFTGAPHLLPTSSNVNPLLQAATTANLAVPREALGAGGAAAAAQGGAAAGGAPGSTAGDTATNHHFHAQTPTSIKLAPLPTYLGEWTKNGFEEAMFLGAQVAARLAFCIHNMDAQGLDAQRQMSLSRVDYK